MTAEELYAMEAETGRTSEWEPLYRAEKARADEALRLMRVDFDRARAAEDRADAAEAEARAFRNGYEKAIGDPVAHAERAARLDAAEAAVARVRALHRRSESRMVAALDADGNMAQYGIPSDEAPTVWLNEPVVEVLCGECRSDWPCATAAALDAP